MNPSQIIGFFTGIFLFFSISQIEAQSNFASAIHHSILTQHQDFSGAVTIINNQGEPIYTKGYGYADNQLKIKNSPTTSFGTASLGKVYTMISILQLKEANKLSLNDSIGKYINGFNDPRAEKVTIMQLLNHTAGWGHYWENQYYLEKVDSLKLHKDWIKVVADIPLAFDPGSDYLYSNIGYILLGAIIEEITGDSYHEYVKREIFQKVGMYQSRFSNIDSSLTFAQSSQIINTHDKSGNIAWADGGAYSSLEDLQRLVDAMFYQKTLINDTSLELLLQDFGEESKDYFEIQGGFPGVSTLLVYQKTSGYSMIVLANQDPPIAETIARNIIPLLHEHKFKSSVSVVGVTRDFSNDFIVPYVSIGIFEKGLGTASSEHGTFNLDVPKDNLSDTLTFSALGYEPIHIPVKNLIFSDSLVIRLKPIQYSLDDEVVVYAERTKKVTLGTKVLSPIASGAYIGGGKPGASLITHFEIPKSPSYLSQVEVHVKNNKKEKPFKLRLRILEVENNKPGKDLLTKDYIVISNEKEGWISFELGELLELYSDVFIGIEWIEQPDNEVNPRSAFPRISYVNSGKTLSFARTTSLDKWNSIGIKPFIKARIEF